MIGQTLGNYRILEQIGVGGMATVYKAYDPDTDRYVAIKVLPRHLSQDPTFRERFEREARAIARLEHLHILPIFAYGEDDGVAYMAMRYLQAGTLTDRLKTGALPLAEANRLLDQIASALDHAHRNGVLHRDIKPSNVLLDESGNAFLTDFGIAKMVESDQDLTRGDILGTPAYMSPEQCQGVRNLTPATDIYSLGIVLYEMVTGRTPFQAETPIALIHKQLREPLPMPRSLRSDLPEEAEKVILKALAKIPDTRYQTCGEMATAFAEAVTSQPIAETEGQQPASLDLSPGPADVDATLLHPAGSTAVASPPDKFPRRRRWLWFGAVLVIGLLIVGAIFLVMPPNMNFRPSREAIQIGDPPAQPEAGGPQLPELRTIEPCAWAELGNGVCIYSELDDTPPLRLFTDEPLEIIGAPTWSPDGQYFAFSALAPGQNADTDTGIFIAKADGSELRRLPTFGNDLFPTWSPNGEWLAFHSSGNLAIRHPDGSDAHLIMEANGELCSFFPEWAPDSETIVVSLGQGDCDWSPPLTRNIVVIKVNGSMTEVVSVDHPPGSCMEPNVAFHPNNRTVAYLDSHCRPVLVAANGLGPPRPIEEFPWEWTSNYFPRWSKQAPPDRAESEAAPERYLRVMDFCHSAGYDADGFCIFDIDGEAVEPVLQDENFDPGSFSGYSWSPDGEYIVFAGGWMEDGESRLHFLNVASGQVSDFFESGNFVDPAWSPDGEWLVFHHNGNLAVATVEGSQFEIILDEANYGCSFRPQWSPDSDTVVVSVTPAGCIWDYPFERRIMVVSRDGLKSRVLMSTNHDSNCEDLAVAFNIEGNRVAYLDGECQPNIINVDGVGQAEPIEEFPWPWTSMFYPQWASFPGR